MKSTAAKVLVAVLAVVIVPFTVVGWNDEEMKDGGQQERNLRATNLFSSKTIVEVAVRAKPEFETLVAALTAASLVDALSGPGPFTVFAPTDAAFAALPAGTLDSLLKPSGISTLQDILKYHVVSGEYPKCNLRGGTTTTLKTLNGDTIELKKSKFGRIFVNGVKATLPEIKAENGIIYKINGVLMPPS